jgi:hypothetical protein
VLAANLRDRSSLGKNANTSSGFTEADGLEPVELED